MEIKKIGIKSIILGLPAAIISFYADVFVAGPVVVLILSLLAILVGALGIQQGMKEKHKDTIIYSTIGLVLGLIPYLILLLPHRNWLMPFF